MPDFLARGGFLMIPLLACSVAALAIGLERSIVLWRDRRVLQRRARAFLEPLRRGDRREARRSLNRRSDFLSRLLRHHIGGRSPVDPDEPRRHWKRGLAALAMIATIAPLLGLLGTVTGMIAAFQKVQALAGTAGPADLAGGIWEALLTTAAGLFVAIPCYVAHAAFCGWVNRLIDLLERLRTVCLREYRVGEIARDPKAIAARPVRRRVA
jgi:biopolymer transport protein ExbB